MLSPHARVRERALFTMSLDADRERRWQGVPERVEETIRSRPMEGQTVLARFRAEARRAVQASMFTGG